MKRNLLIILAIVLFENVSAQAPDTVWTKTFGGSGDDVGHSVSQTSDGGYAIVGYTHSFGAGDDDFWLIRTDANGDTIWTKTFGGKDGDIGYSVQQTSDSGFIITGLYNTPDLNFGDVLLIKTDANGDILWTKSFGTNSSTDIGHSVQQTLDNGYIITGTFWGAGPQVFLARTDSNGELLWLKRYESKYTGDVECSDSGNSVQQTSDGGYILAGTIGSWTDTYSDIWLIRVDANGDTLWTKRFSVEGDQWGNSVRQTQDGGFIVTGGCVMKGGWIIRTDTNGDTLWTTSFQGNISFGQQTSDGGYIFVGSSWGDVKLMRTNASGDTLWTKRCGGNGHEWSHSLQQTFDGGYIITGSTRYPGAVDDNVYLIRIAPESGTLVENNAILESDSYKLLQNYPNPFNSLTKISYSTPYFGLVTLVIFDIRGREIQTLVSENHEAGYHTLTFNAGNLPSGIYLYKLKVGNNFLVTKKMLILR